MSRSGGSVLQSYHPPYCNNTHSSPRNSHPKATWQKVEEDENDEDKDNATKKQKNPPMNGKSRRPFSSLGAMETGPELGNDNGLKSKKGMHDLKLSTLLKPRIASRNCVSAMGIQDEHRNRKPDSNYSPSPGVNYDNHSNKSSELDFADKIKAFRALISLKRKGERDSNKEGQSSRGGFDGRFEASGRLLKFNSHSLERLDAPSSSSNHFLNEFQMTYEQDRERSRKRLLMSDTNLVSDAAAVSRRQTQKFGECEQRKTTDLISPEAGPDQSNYENARLDGLGQRDPSTPVSDRATRKPCIRVIKRPNVQDGGAKTKEEKDLYYSSRNNNVDEYSSENYDYSDRVGRLVTHADDERLMTNAIGMYSAESEKVMRDAKQFERADKASQSLKQHHSRPDNGRSPRNVHRDRPSSVSGTYSSRTKDDASYLAEQSHALARYRPISALSLSERLNSDVDYRHDVATDQKPKPSDGAFAKDSDQKPKLGAGAFPKDSSLKAHLNVLGASLSSLSSRLNGDSSDSDGRSLTSDLDRRLSRSSSLSTIANSKTSGEIMFSENPVSHPRSRHSRADFDVRHVEVSMRGRHNLHTVSSSPGIYESSSSDNTLKDIATYREACTKSYSEYTSHALRSRSSEHPGENDMKRKQTNVKLANKDDDDDYDSNNNNRIRPNGVDIPMGKREGIESSRHSEDIDNDDDDGDDSSDDEVSSESSAAEHRDDLRNTANYIAKQGKLRAKPKVKAVIARPPKDFETYEDSDTIIELGINDRDHILDSHLPCGEHERRTKSQPQISDQDIDARRSHAVCRRVISRIKSVSRSASNNGRSNIDRAEVPHAKTLQGLPLKEKDCGENTGNIFKERRAVIMKRPPSHKTGSRQSINGQTTGSTTVSSKTAGTGRSLSSLGISHRGGSPSVQAKTPTPMGGNSRDSRGGHRPHTSLGNVGNAKKDSTSTRRRKDESASGENGRVKLFDKVQRLHEEIDERLRSQENVAHNHRMKTRLSFGNDGSDSSEETRDVVRTSTPVKSRVETSPDSSEKDHVPRNMKPLTSSARFSGKSRVSGVPSPSPRMGIKSLNLDALPNSPRSQLSDKLKKVIAARSRLTPDLVTSRRHSKLSNDRYETNNENGDEGQGHFYPDDDKDEDETLPSWRTRSGSVGSKRNVNKKDFVSRILGKMSTNEKRPTYKDNMAANSITSRLDALLSKQRSPSPTDTLLGYLDNPHMVTLLQKLYKADPYTRQVIMVKVQYFKAWQQHSVKAKQKRLWKESLQERSDRFCYQRLLELHFITWERRATHSRNMRQALSLFRTHMLVKGFRALKWSVSHSRHQTGQLQAKVHKIALRMSFHKWQTKAEKHRRSRIEQAMQRWKQFVTEAQKIRHMQELIDFNTTNNVLRTWKIRYSKRVKENLAFQYLRRTLLKHALTTWCAYITMTKRKKEKYVSAVSLHKQNLIHTTFYQMIISFKKSKKARVHFRQQKLSDVFWAWKQASQICRSERKADMEVSIEQWQRQCINQSFIKWRERLMYCKAEKHSDLHVCKRAFHVWIYKWQNKITQRKEIEAAIEKNKLHRSLLTWRRNVVQIRRCHRQAVIILEKCHLGHTLRVWRMYSIIRTTLKRKIFVHQYEHQKRVQASCFASWLSLFRQRVDEVKAKQLWSYGCARKVALHWKQVCHKRFLERQLHDSHADRELRFVQAIFKRWLHALDKNEREKEEAEEKKKILEKISLQKKFQLWKTSTQKQLLIKPLVMKRVQQSLSQCFNEWHIYVKKVVCCRRSKLAFDKLQLAKAFSIWRCQSRAHEVEKRIKNSMTKGLLSCYLHEWQFFVWRKKECLRFHQGHLVQRTFLFWKGRAASQCFIRAEKEEEEENNLDLKHRCFKTWWLNSHSEKVANDQQVEGIVHVREAVRLKRAFCLWRRQMHSAMIARSYQKTASMRLLQTFLSAWYDSTTQTMSIAVGNFSEKIGLTVGGNPTMQRGTVGKQCSSTQGDEVDFSTLEEDGDVMNNSLNGSLSSTFSLGSSARRLFGETERSIDSDADRHFLLSGGLQDVMEEHANKCHRLRETVVNAIIRLQHWPVYPAFQQWVEFTARQRELKETTKQVQNLVTSLETKLAFRQWRVTFLAHKASKEHANFVILSSNFGALTHYCRHRKFVKELSVRAHKFCMLLTFQKFFPVWLSKAQNQRQEKHVVQLWTTRTEREIELFPLENKLKQRFGNKTVRQCFSIWLLKHHHFEKIQRVYHRNTIQWLFNAWRNWASHQQHLRRNMRVLLERRQTTLALQMWKKRYHQSRETEKRFQLSWQRNIHEIFVEWHAWTKDSKQRQVSFKCILRHQSQRLLSSYMLTWKSLAAKYRNIKRNHEARLVCSIFKEWRCVVVTSKKQHEKVLQIQVVSYTLLVKRLFRQWYILYNQQKLKKEEKLKQCENNALKLALVWRKKCQKSRGAQLHQVHQHRQRSLCFQIWKEKYGSILCLYDKLEKRQKEKNLETLRSFLRQWTTRLHGDQAARVFQCRMLFTTLQEWSRFARENRERRIRGLALHKALQERSLHVYFQYWKAVTKVKQSIQKNADMKLQIKLFSAWLSYTRHARYLQKVEEHVTQRMNTRILTNAFLNMKWRAEYCQNLNEVADRMLRDRTDATLRAVLVLWKDRLNRINAARCYGHILAVRTCRHWCRFVAKRKAEREKDKSDLLKAEQYDRRQICKRAFLALKMEVSVSRLAQKHRQRLCDKYALVWKTKVDLQVTAMEMEWDLTCRHAWCVWRKEYHRQTAAKKVVKKEDNLVKSRVFKAWLRISSKGKNNASKSLQPQNLGRKSSLTSLLPVPVTQTRSSSSSPSPTLYSSQQASSHHFGFKTGKHS